jgi:hypothetical protein
MAVENHHDGDYLVIADEPPVLTELEQLRARVAQLEADVADLKGAPAPVASPVERPVDP